MAKRDYARRGHDHSNLGQNVQNADYTFRASDAGKLVSKTAGGGGETYTIPANELAGAATNSFDDDAFDTDALSSSAFNFENLGAATGILFPVGTMIAIDNSGGGALSIAILTDILVWTKNNSQGTRSLATGGVAVLLKVNSTTWKISGEALT